MLSEVLKKSTCADCGFCCSFRRTSLWETPLFSQEFIKKYETKENAFNIEEMQDKVYGRMKLSDRYETEAAEEEIPCFYLDKTKGCMLTEKDKPLDCKIWPLRIMKKDNELVIALTPTCPAINSVGEERMKKLVENGLGDYIYEEALKMPYMIKEYREGFPILKSYVEASELTTVERNNP